MTLLIEDTTLREGEQSPGVAFSVDEKVEIAARLDALGIGAIEVGTPAMGGPEEEAVRRIVKEGLRARVIGWNRGRREDLERSFDCELDSVHIGLPASDHHLDKKFKRSREWVLDQLQELVGFAKSQGAWVSVSAEDTGRADRSFLVEYARAAKAAGADRLRMSDSIGVLDPFSAHDTFAEVSAGSGIPLQAHMHNDFGLATANTLAAVRGGAQHVHATVNGLGERAGIAPLDEVVMGLERHLGIETGIDTSGLVPLARYVSEASNRPIPPNKPIAGKSIFEHESGIHVDATLKLPTAFEPFPPELVGGERRIVIGKHSGRAAVVHVLAEAGVHDPEDVQGFLTELRYYATEHKRAVEPDEVVRLYEARVRT